MYRQSILALDLINPSFLPLRELLNTYDIEKIIAAYNLKGFSLNDKNKLYTNIHNGISLTSLIEITNQIIFTQGNLFTVKSKPYTILLVDNSNLNGVTGTTEDSYIIVAGNISKDTRDYVKVVSHELMHR